ncbi:twin-arginine translocation signal domain-containing protein [Campylobacter coli]|nr:twin-arginine translocation signal domain-containing protein [Campylobacter coli]EIA73132.1 Tat pathway signal sequence domain-containing protein [Campylobacter coli 7--1]APA59164.1 Tat pathway signal protein [Campylobacter coli]APA60446.1 Tat pathway signal protein [Campylobacter coli]EAC2152707.1 twin-arginine translocation signal domain-containing protein [Campylobacter coli]EAC2164068.1 twin-arginine translocation signal domain-containing protein [Campylobacter coli]
MKNRREFLKKSAIALGTASLLGGASVAFGQDQDEERKDLVRGKSKKKEVLYQRSANWEKYYIRAE